MPGIDPDRPTTRLPRGLLGMLALVAAVELTIASRRTEFTTVWADDWRRTAGAATSEAKGRDVLCFGDSLVKFGVLPRVIEARTGLRAYNLAVNAGTMPSAYFLLRRALGSGARPRAIVADFFCPMLPDDPPTSVRTYPDLATARDCLDLAWTSGDASFLARTLLGKLLPSHQCRFEIRDSILAALGGRRAPLRPELWPLRETWKAEQGAQPTRPTPARPAADPSAVDRLSPAGWSCDPINAAYCERFLALAEAERIPVFWLIPPLGPEVQARRRAVGADEAYGKMAREALDRHPGVVVLDARGAGYEGAVYCDAIHLDRRGAGVLTADLAAVVADRLRGRRTAGRWVELPPFAGRSTIR